ncbi:MAG: OmpA family protein [Bacteroidales bacterium]|nr:OmpA family protein [Bacteroidales bacterium]
MKYIFTVLIFISSLSALSAQNKYYSNKKKAVKEFETALQNYNLQYYARAKQNLYNALKIDAKFLDAYVLLAEIGFEQGNKKEAIEYFEKALHIDKDYFPMIYLRKADLELQTGQYSKAKADYNKFLSYKKESKRHINYIKNKIESCDFAENMLKHKVSFHPENLGTAINSPLSEYWPSITADGKIITFTRSNRDTHSQEDLFYSEKVKDQWLTAKNIGTPINTAKSEGAQSISADGHTMVFTACLRNDGVGSCDIYISHKIGNTWTKPVNMGSPVNSKYKETQPALTADGKAIYFVSNRPGGKGAFDIWYSFLQKNGKWSIPVNLGDSINTKEDELAPFIHYDGKTLYFSSFGHQGMGGSDMFLSRRIKDTVWTKPLNLGYPINTYFNEESMIVSADGKLGMFSSDIEGGYGQKDIYSFELYEKIRPYRTLFAKGLVYDAKTNKPLQADIEITGLKDSSSFKTVSDKISGDFLITLFPDKSYAFNVIKNGYLPYSKNLFLPDSNIIIKIPLQPVELGKVFVLRNIFFDIDKYQLKAESFAELDMLKDFLANNKKLVVEIQGHTDNTGTLAHNKILSVNRAKAVYDYLVLKGIDKKRLTYKGFADTQAIASNNTKEGRALNRRTAFKIIAD